jgi:ABC-type uncharacterized transport system permease subunit
MVSWERYNKLTIKQKEEYNFKFERKQYLYGFTNSLMVNQIILGLLLVMIAFTFAITMFLQDKFSNETINSIKIAYLNMINVSKYCLVWSCIIGIYYILCYLWNQWKTYKFFKRCENETS